MIRRLDQYLVKLVIIIIITIKTSPCVAVSRAVSAIHAMIVDDDQSTMYVISRCNACALRGQFIEPLIVPKDISYHLTFKSKENVVLYTSCTVKDHFHFAYHYCQRERCDHFDHFDV